MEKTNEDKASNIIGNILALVIIMFVLGIEIIVVQTWEIVAFTAVISFISLIISIIKKFDIEPKVGICILTLIISVVLGIVLHRVILKPMKLNKMCNSIESIEVVGDDNYRETFSQEEVKKRLSYAETFELSSGIENKFKVIIKQKNGDVIKKEGHNDHKFTSSYVIFSFLGEKVQLEIIDY